MKRIVRLTERDLTRLVSRVIIEQTSSHNIFTEVDNIPCIKEKLPITNDIFKVNDPKVVSKFKGLGSKPVFTGNNILVYDGSDVLLPEEKYGSVTIYANGRKGETIDLDGTPIGDELYSIMNKQFVAQDDDDYFKIGWVYCNGALYIYDRYNM